MNDTISRTVSDRLYYAYTCSDPNDYYSLFQEVSAQTMPGGNSHTVTEQPAWRQHTGFIVCVNQFTRHQGNRTFEGCWNQYFPDNPRPAPLVLTEAGRRFCGEYVQNAERLIRWGELRREYERGRPFFDLMFSALPLSDRASLSGVMSFYEAQLPEHRSFEILNDNVIPEIYRRRRASYADGSLAREIEHLNPVVCRDARLWERLDVSVSDIPNIPVFVRREQSDRYEDYRDSAQVVFEMMKLFFPMPVMREILRGSGRGDFGLVLAPNAPVNPSLISDGMLSAQSLNNPGIGGQALFNEGYIWVREDIFSEPPILMMTGDDGRRHPIVSQKLDILFHEMGHHLDFTRLSHDIRSDLAIYFSQLQSLFEATPSNRFVAPMNRAIENPWLRRGERQGTPYAFTNIYELFAELVSEYFRVEFVHLSRQAFYETDVDAAKHIRARHTLMQEFFSFDGLNPAAFRQENIRRIYHDEGIELPSIDESGNRPMTLEPRVAACVDREGNVGVEASVLYAGQSSRHMNYLMGPIFGARSGAFVGFEFGLRTPAAALQMELGLSTGYNFDSGLFFGLNPRVLYHPSENSGWYVFGGGEVNGNANGLQPDFQIGVGYTPRITTPFFGRGGLGYPQLSGQ